MGRRLQKQKNNNNIGEAFHQPHLIFLVSVGLGIDGCWKFNPKSREDKKQFKEIKIYLNSTAMNF